MKILLAFCSLCLATLATGQHTFSIVAVDTETGEIGSAGATCGDSIVWPGTPGAYLISDVLPGVGAIHTQAWYLPANQALARAQMQLGDAPDDIIQYLIDNDVQNAPVRRQYLVIDYNEGAPRSAGFTGDDADDYKGHLTGEGYVIAGNILLGPEILDSMEARFLSAEGCLSDKLMAAMQGANVRGADTRCWGEGVSSKSAFLRVAAPDDVYNELSLDINVAGTDWAVEPIDVLQERYDNWKSNNSNDCLLSSTDQLIHDEFSLYPNPVNDQLNISINAHLPEAEIQIRDLAGKPIMKVHNVKVENQINLSGLDSGLYLISLMSENAVVNTQFFVKL